MKPTTQIECPNCHTLIDVQDVLLHQVEEKLKLEFQHKIDAEKSRIKQKEELLEKSKLEFEEKKKQENSIPPTNPILNKK